MSSTPKVWFITGCSGGFGISLARAVLAHGHHVIASSRDPSKTPALVEEIKQKGGHWVSLDVTKPAEEVKKAVGEAAAFHGRLDIVVNNAGYGVFGAIEDIDENMARAQFETNVLGVIKVTQAALGSMQPPRSGTVVNIGSISGLIARPGLSLYASSKFALEALSESLSLEIEPFGGRVLLVEPGLFRTNFMDQGAAWCQPLSEPYQGTITEETIRKLQDAHGQQAGDPEKAAERIYEVVMAEGMAKGKKTYLRLLLGSNAFDGARKKVAYLQENLLALEDISRSTEYE